MSTPSWNPDNLLKHHAKRIRRDDEFWREILGLNRSMTRDEYEKESEKIYRNASLEYEAEYSRHRHALYRVDKRCLLSICDRTRRWMITCFYKGHQRKHEHGSASPKLEHVLEHIDDLEADLDGELEKLFRIDPVTENLSSNQVRKYINPKLKSLRRRCVTGE